MTCLKVERSCLWVYDMCLCVCVHAKCISCFQVKTNALYPGACVAVDDEDGGNDDVCDLAWYLIDK